MTTPPSTLRPTSRHARLAPYLAWGAVALAACGFWWSLPLHFAGDDFAYVWRFNALPWSDWPSLFLREWSGGIWGNPLRELRPLAALSLMIDTRLWGGNAAGYHLTNLLLHLACSWVVMLTARDVLRQGWVPAAAAGALFAAHPVHAEAVAWITARADLLAALGCLTSFYGIVRFRASHHPAWLVLAWCAYVAGIFSKEFCLVLPLLVLTFDLLFPRRGPNATWWRLLLPYLGFALLMALYFWCRSQALGAQVGANAIPWLTKDFWRQVAQREFIYLGELFWPVASWLPVAEAQRRLALQVLLRMVGAVLVAGSILWWFDRRKGAIEARAALFFLLAWFLLATMPFVVTYISARHLYLASAGICLGVIAVLVRTLRSPVAFAAVAVLLVLACELRLHEHGERWREASRLSAAASRAVTAVANAAAPGDALLISVPGLSQDVWVWAWASPFALRPPFQNEDLEAKLVVLEGSGVYAFANRWAAHPSIPKLRNHAGPVWVISGDTRVETRRVSAEDFAAARQQLEAPLEEAGSFERLLGILLARPAP